MPENAMKIEPLLPPSPTKEARLKKAHRDTLAARLGALVIALLIGVLYFLLPPYLQFGPSWLLLALEILVLLPVIVSWLMRRPLPHITSRVLTLVALASMTVALALAVTLMIITLPDRIETGRLLLRSAIALWSFNVLVFALWYWEIDGGGPLLRHLNGYPAADFLFPQQITIPIAGWRL